MVFVDQGLKMGNLTFFGGGKVGGTHDSKGPRMGQVCSMKLERLCQNWRSTPKPSGRGNY